MASLLAGSSAEDPDAERTPPPPRGRTRYRALLVDFGGVLTTSVTASFAAFCLSTGVSPERLKFLLAPAYASGRSAQSPRRAAAGLAADAAAWVPAIETGRMSVEEFSDRLAELLSEGLAEPLSPDGITQRMFGELRPDDRMIGAVRRARRQGLKTGLVSNTWGLGGASDQATDLFDVRILSGVAGVRKPDPEIYLLAARELGIRAQECVFVDDLPANVEGARAVGMAGVVHKDASITIPRLEDLLGVPLS